MVKSSVAVGIGVPVEGGGVVSGDPKWFVVAQALADDVRSRRYGIGDRIPTPRDMVLRFDADPNTIARGICYLRDLGVLDPRPGSGTFVVKMPPKVLPQTPPVSPLERRILDVIDGLRAEVVELQRLVAELQERLDR